MGGMRAKIVDPSHFDYNQVKGFWQKVNINIRVEEPDKCWPWTGSKGKEGRGYWRPSWRHESIKHVAARVALALAEDRIVGEDDYVLHSCDTPNCCNPKHLRVGTLQDNADDRTKRGRNNHVFGPSHPKTSLTEDDVRLVRTLRSEGWSDGMLSFHFNVSRGVVNQILSGKSYKWVL